MHLGALQVVPAQRLEVGRPQFAHRLGVVDAIGPVPVQGGRHPAQVRQLRSAFNLAVAGQYLLDQGGAGAGQPKDEYRRRIRMALACGTLQERGIEGLDDLVVGRLGLHRIIVFKHPLLGVAALVVVPGGVEVARILMRLGQRKQEVDRGLIGEFIGPLQG